MTEAKTVASRVLDGEDDESDLRDVEARLATAALDDSPEDAAEDKPAATIIRWPDGFKYDMSHCFVCGQRAPMDGEWLMDMEYVTTIQTDGKWMYVTHCPGEDSKCKLRGLQEIAMLLNHYDILPLPEAHPLRQVPCWIVKTTEGKEIKTEPGDYLCWNRTSTDDDVDDASKRVLCMCCCIKEKNGEHQTVRVPLADLAKNNAESFAKCNKEGLALVPTLIWSEAMLEKWNKALSVCAS